VFLDLDDMLGDRSRAICRLGARMRQGRLSVRALAQAIVEHCTCPDGDSSDVRGEVNGSGE
jgi:hypothetical protein